MVKITSGKQQDYFRAQLNSAKPVKVESLHSVLSLDEIRVVKRLGIKVKECYHNAWKVATTIPGVKYVEGYTFLYGIPIEHAWNEKDGKYFDVTEELALQNKLNSDYTAILELDELEVYRYAEKTGHSGSYIQIWFKENFDDMTKDILKNSIKKAYLDGELSLNAFLKSMRNLSNLVPKKVQVRGKGGKVYQAIRWVNPYGDVKGREETKQKEEENQEQGKKFELKTYYVTFHTDTSSESLLETKDYDEAKDVFNDYDVNDLEDNMKNRSGMSVVLSSKTDTYKFILEGEDIDDYPLEDYYDDPEVYELVDEGDFEDEEYRNIEPANKKSEELLDDIQRHFYEKYGSFKYNIIEVLGEEDEDGFQDTLGKIKLRISDHTENINNVDRFDRGDFHISVVVADFDATEKRFGFSNAMERRRNEFELKFDSDTNLEDAIYEIEQQIEECTEMIIN